MNNAELNVVKFGESDVIATSTFTLAGTFNGTLNDATVTIKGTTYKNTASANANLGFANEDLVNAFNAEFGAGAFKSIGMELPNNGFGYDASLFNVIYYDSADRSPADYSNDNTGLLTSAGNYNATWRFNGTNFVKVTQ